MAHVSTEGHNRASHQAIEGVQNEPPQNSSQQVNYFELKKRKAQETQEELFYFPLNYLK